jgi:hypothetical protein
LIRGFWRGMVFDMTRFIVGFAAVVAVAGWGQVWAEAPAGAMATFDSYVGAVEGRLASQHRSSPEGFLAGAAAERDGLERVRRGALMVEQITPPAGSELPGALLHHWRGTGFAQGARAADFERLLRDFGEYPKTFAPEVLSARTIAANGDRVQGWMRVRQRHGITVVMDSQYDVQFGRLDARDGWSASRSTRIAEVAGAGTNAERELEPREEHGFLWRMNTYWSWEERDGGLYMQVESMSLTRGIPVGLGWAVRPFVESIPRESVEFTLRAAVKRLQVAGYR